MEHLQNTQVITSASSSTCIWKKADVICSNFARAMDDADARTDYSTAETKYRNYRGKQILDQPKEDHRHAMLQNKIKDALGEPPGFSHQTINFDELNKDLDIFLTYLTQECRKKGGGLHRAVSYTGMRSSLGFLYCQYNRTQTRAFAMDLSEDMSGIRNLCTQAQQHGKGNIKDGIRSLS